MASSPLSGKLRSSNFGSDYTIQRLAELDAGVKDAGLKPTCTSLPQRFVKVKLAEGGAPVVEREV
jgi:hypothetical protein